MPTDSAAWTLDRIAPPDNTYRDAGDAVHQAFWEWIAQKGVDRFHWRCNQGLDRNGRGLTPIKEATWKRGRKRSYTGLGNANAPPLSPALGLSRTESLLRGHGFDDHAEWHWDVDPVTGLDWGQVMLWHREGAGFLPVRDVIGWSREDILFLQSQGAQWWYAHQHGTRLAAAMHETETRQEKFPRVAGAQPRKIAAKGRMDVEHFTFGVGASEAVVRRSIEEGTFSGFSKSPRYRPPGKPGGGKAAPKPPPTMPIRPMAKAPAPKVRRPAAVAQPLGAASLPSSNPLAFERPQRTPEPFPPDLATFAARAKAAAKTVGPEGRFFADKVYISHAHAAYERVHGPILIADYKALLVRSTQARHLNLSRADLVEAMREIDVSASETWHPYGASYHFIRMDY